MVHTTTITTYKRGLVLLLVLAAMLLAAMLLAACGQDNAATIKMTQVKVVSMPEDEALNIELTEADGAPVTDATVRVEGNMTHAGMAPVMTDAVTDDADGAADGVYRVPFRFTMNGDWIITVSVQLADGTTETHDVELTATETGVEID